MKQRINVITLGVTDLGRTGGFYEVLGWNTAAEPDADVAFFQAGDVVLSLWDRARLAKDSCVGDSGGWGNVTLALNLGSPEELNAVSEEARWGSEDRPRAGRDLLGRIQIRLRGPRRASLGARIQPALAPERGWWGQLDLKRAATSKSLRPPWRETKGDLLQVSGVNSPLNRQTSNHVEEACGDGSGPEQSAGLAGAPLGEAEGPIQTPQQTETCPFRVFTTRFS
jgi:uncharacterized protein